MTICITREQYKAQRQEMIDDAGFSGLTTRAINALMNYGIKNKAELDSIVSSDGFIRKLEKIPEMGKKSVLEIISFYGLGQYKSLSDATRLIGQEQYCIEFLEGIGYKVEKTT